MKIRYPVLGWGLGALLLYCFLAYFFDIQATKKLLLQANISLVLMAVLCFAFSLVLRAIKWTYLLKVGDNITWKNGYHIIIISNMVNFIFPVRVGEVLKLYLAKKLSEVSYPVSIASTLTDRLSHMAALLISLLFAVTGGMHFFDNIMVFALFFCLFFFTAAAVFFYGSDLFVFFEKKISTYFENRTFGRFVYGGSYIKNKVIPTIEKTFKQMNYASYSRVNLVVIILLPFFTLFIDGLCYYFIFKAFGIFIHISQGITAACLMNIMFILPTAPGQVGTAEIYPVMIFAWGFGFPSTMVSSVGLLWHILTTCIILGMGCCSLFMADISISNAIKKIKEYKP